MSDLVEEQLEAGVAALRSKVRGRFVSGVDAVLRLIAVPGEGAAARRLTVSYCAGPRPRTCDHRFERFSSSR